MGWNSGVLASFCPHYHHHPVAPVSVGLLAPPTPLVGFSSLSDGAGCYGNCICLQDPQIAEPINPFPSHPPPDPAAIASKQPQRPAPPPPSSPWVSLPLLSHQVSSPLSSFPPLPAPAFPFVCCSLWFVSHCGLASHLAFENLHFSFLHPDRLALERSPLPRSLSAILVVRLPGSLPHHRTINQPFSSLFGAFSSPPPFAALPPPLSLLSPITQPTHLALAHSTLLALPAHTSLTFPSVGLPFPPSSPSLSPLPSFSLLPHCLTCLFPGLPTSFLLPFPGICCLPAPWSSPALTSLSLHHPLLPPLPVSFLSGLHGLRLSLLCKE